MASVEPAQGAADLAVKSSPPPPQVSDDLTAANESDGQAQFGSGGTELEPHEGERAKKKKNRRNKSMAARGPTALPKNRGTGFEGTLPRPLDLLFVGEHG